MYSYSEYIYNRLFPLPDVLHLTISFLPERLQFTILLSKPFAGTLLASLCLRMSFSFMKDIFAGYRILSWLWGGVPPISSGLWGDKKSTKSSFHGLCSRKVTPPIIWWGQGVSGVELEKIVYGQNICFFLDIPGPGLITTEGGFLGFVSISLVPFSYFLYKYSPILFSCFFYTSWLGL